MTTAAGKRQFQLDIMGHTFMMLPVDMALDWDPAYRSHIEFYDANRVAFRSDAEAAWVKLTELGCEGLLHDE